MTEKKTGTTLFERACRGQRGEHAPVWIMRQAGRYLPEYRALRTEVDFLTATKTPELAAEITLQPLKRFELDAAILFSDIMTPLEGMGIDLAFNPGPVIGNPIRTAEAARSNSLLDPYEASPYVMEALSLIRADLRDEAALIGFAGAPFTLFCYMVEGGGSKDFMEARSFLRAETEAATGLLDVLGSSMARYLVAQAKAGANAVMLFDSWVGLLGPDNYRRFVLPVMQRTVREIRAEVDVPILYFANGGATLLADTVQVGADAMGIDWSLPLSRVTAQLGQDVVIQGNLDPATLFAPRDELGSAIDDVLHEGRDAAAHIFNLGHGIHRTTDPDRVAFLVDRVHETSRRLHEGQDFSRTPSPADMSSDNPSTGVLFINFGEPAEPTREAVIPFLERIFLQNASLEHHTEEESKARARTLAERRAPGLIEEYEAIGGSPLNGQAKAQAAALQEVLDQRGADARVYSAFQFMEPTIAHQMAAARRDGVETLMVLPVYPICGQSTTVEALRTVRKELTAMEWDPELVLISGWHHHPDYLRLRSDNVQAFVDEHGLDLNDEDTLLYFSVHGTPIKYLDEGNRYDRYVEESCRDLARVLGTDRFEVGFQNHTNRGIAWTQPDNEDLIESVPETRLVVVPLAFMHEQSETLAELDHELRAFAEKHGKEFHRVPVPHDAEAFPRLLAILLDEAQKSAEGDGEILAPCRCSDVPGTWCTNGARELPASPYATPPTAQPA